jgi:riboflavin synthase
VLEGTKPGDSLAVNGVCLTVTSLSGGAFEVDVMPETLSRTNLGELCYGERVNLERALALGGRLGGHLVLGHVDDVGRVVSVTPREDARIMRIALPARLTAYISEKGFVAGDGVSLTVVDVDDFSFSVSLVAYTLEHTILGDKSPGSAVNLEVDVIARYLERLGEKAGQGLSIDLLEKYGFAKRGI